LKILNLLKKFYLKNFENFIFYQEEEIKRKRNYSRIKEGSGGDFFFKRKLLFGWTILLKNSLNFYSKFDVYKLTAPGTIFTES